MSAPLTGKCDWAHVTMDELKSGLDNEPEVYDMKVDECKQCWQVKEEAKEKEAREHQQREEAECCTREETAAIWRQEEADCWFWCHAPNMFGTVNMGCTVNSRLSWSKQ